MSLLNAIIATLAVSASLAHGLEERKEVPLREEGVGTCQNPIRCRADTDRNGVS